MKQYILTFTAILYLGSLIAQSDDQTYSTDIPTLLELERSLSQFHEIELAALIKEYDHTNHSDWKDLLPSVGVAYTPSGAPRPSASWSPLQILDRKENKEKRKSERASLLLSHNLLLTDRLFKLRQLYHDYQVDINIVNTKSEMISIDEKLFEITETKYQENIIKPSEYLKAKKAIIVVRSNIEQLTQELIKKKNELLYTAKWSDTTTLLYSSD
jgi:hypothetical protein